MRGARQKKSAARDTRSNITQSELHVVTPRGDENGGRVLHGHVTYTFGRLPWGKHRLTAGTSYAEPVPGYWTDRSSGDILYRRSAHAVACPSLLLIAAEAKGREN